MNSQRWNGLNHSKCVLSRFERSEKVIFGYFATFMHFSKKWSDMVFFVHTSSCG